MRKHLYSKDKLFLMKQHLKRLCLVDTEELKELRIVDWVHKKCQYNILKHYINK